MDWWGVLYIVIGLWLVSRAITSLRAGTSSTFWNLIWLAGGAYVVYLGYKKVTAPAPSVLPTLGGRR